MCTVVLAGVAALAVVGLELASRSARVREVLRARAAALLSTATGAKVAIGSLEGSALARTLVVHDLTLSFGGQAILRVPRVEIAYSALALVRGRVVLRRVVLTGLRVRAVRDASGWQLPPRPQGGGGGGMPVVVRELRVEDGRVAVALLDATPPRRVGATAIELDASGALDASRPRLSVASLRFVPRGIALSAVAAAGGIVAGPDGVSVPRAWLTTAETRLDAAGFVDRHGRVSARLTLAPLGARDLRALVPAVRLRANPTVRVVAEGPRDAVALRADLDLGPGGRFAATATLDAESLPPGYTATVRFSDLDPGAAMEGLVRARANGRLRVRGRGTDRNAALAYGLALERSEITGRALDRAELTGRGVRGVHHAHGELSAAGNNVTVHAAGTLRGAPIYHARAHLRLPRLEALVWGAPGWAYGRLALRGRGTEARERHAEVAVTLTAADVRGIPLRGTLRAEMNGTRVRLMEALVEGPELRATSSGTVDLGAPAADVALEATADLPGLGARLGTPLGGAATLRAHAQGTLPSLTAQVALAVERPAYGGVSAEALNLDLDGRRAGDTDRARLALDVRGHADRSAHVALMLTRTPARTAGEVGELTLALGDGPPWRLTHPAAFAVETRLEVADLTLAAGAERVTLAGRVGSSGPADGVLDWAHLRLSRICTLAGGPPCEGELAGRVRLGGDAEAPRLEGEIAAVGIAVDQVHYGDLQARATYVTRALTQHAGLRYPRAGDLRLDGTVPIDLAWAGARQDTSGEPVALELATEGLDLTFLHALAPAQIRESRGRLSARLRLQGPRAAPRADGFLALDDGRFELAAMGVPYENVRLRLKGATTALEIEQLGAEAGGGTLEGAGKLTLTGFRPTALDVRLTMNDFLAVRQAAYEAVLSGPLSLGGTLSDPVLTGDLEVTRAVVRPASLPVSKPPMHPDPSIEVAGAPETEVAPPPPSSAMAEALALALNVRIARSAWIRRVDANIELGGDVKVDKRPHGPVGLDGSIRLLRGWYTFQGRRFTLEDGAILFHGEAPPQPTFDVTASYRTGLYRVEVHVSGSAEKPTLTLTSDPPLDQADVLAVLLFGKPTHELGRGESATLQQQALQLGAGYEAPELQASVMNALGLDTLDLALPQGSSAGQVRAGRYVAQDVFVSLGQEFGKNTAQVVGVEYGLSPHVSVKASTSSRGESAVDLFWHRRY